MEREYPGHAIREINGGASPILTSYSSNTISAVYATPAIVVRKPFHTENNLDVGAVATDVAKFAPTLANVDIDNGSASGWYKR